MKYSIKTIEDPCNPQKKIKVLEIRCDCEQVTRLIVRGLGIGPGALRCQCGKLLPFERTE